MQEIINVIVVDDHQIIVDGLVSLLSEREEINVVAGVTSAKEALNVISKNIVDVAIIDIHMPEITGIELTKLIRGKFEHVRVIALSMHDDSSLINKMIEAGASGYVLKSSSMNEVAQAISKVAQGHKYLSSEVQSIIMENIFFHDDAIRQIEPNVPKLSPREAEILQLIAKEYTSEKIGEKLFISPRTVETHRKNIFTKTGTKSIVGLIRYAIEHDLIKE